MLTFSTPQSKKVGPSENSEGRMLTNIYSPLPGSGFSPSPLPYADKGPSLFVATAFPASYPCHPKDFSRPKPRSEKMPFSSGEAGRQKAGMPMISGQETPKWISMDLPGKKMRK